MDIFESLDAGRNKFDRWINNKIPSGIAGMNPYYIMTHPKKWNRVPKHYYHGVRCRYMRGKNGWDYTDTWSLDHYLLSWLPEAIAYLRDNSHGYPGGLDDDVYPHIQALSFDTDDPQHAKWLAILTQIEEGLKDGRTILDIMQTKDMTKEEIAALEENFNAAWTLMGKWFFALWD